MAINRLLAYTSRETLFASCIAGIVVTTITAGVRIYVRIKNQRRLYEDDYALLVAWALYIALAALYIADIPYMWGFLDFTSGKTAYSDAVADDFYHMMLFNFAVTPMFWAVLWAVKLSLLLFFRRIVDRTDWMRTWWVILVVTVLAFAGCLITQFLSCDSIADFTVLGACTKPSNQRAQIISLYFAFAADVMTDVAIMALPLYVVFRLQMTTRDKLSVAALFSTNIIAIVVSMIRVFLIWASTGSDSPSPSWLALWAILECMVVIICGCVPAISQMFRTSGRRSSGPDIQYSDGSRHNTGSAAHHTSSLNHRPEVSSSKEYLTPVQLGVYDKSRVVARNKSLRSDYELEEL